MADSNLKNLPPEERIKRLKKLEQDRKKEIEEAHRQIQETESELTERRKWVDRVPIPEIAKEEMEGLSEEGKQLLRVHRGTTTEKASKVEEETTPTKAAAPRLTLEEALAQEQIAKTSAANVEYRPLGSNAVMEYKPLGQRPMNELYQAITELKETIQQKGYISSGDERKAEYLSGIVEERLEAGREGRYASFNEEVARMGSLAQQLGSGIVNAYQNKIKVSGHDWYKSSG